MSAERGALGEGLREPQRLSRQLSALLAADIVSGRIGVGEPFASSEEIVTKYNVSRTVAREMVQTLAMLGMVNVQHGKRTEVKPPEDWDILSDVVQEALLREGKAAPLLRDLYEFRLIIEPQAASWMAENGDDRDLAHLDELAGQMEQAVDADGSLPDLMEADRAFHDLIARASGNQVVAAVSRDIRELLGTLWGISHVEAADALDVAEQHRAISDAIGRRDAAGAGEAMRAHLLWAAHADLHGSGEVAGLRPPMTGTVSD